MAGSKSGYDAGPPWTFTGRAWYQLTMVKASLAKQLIPPELNVVEAFGYTLGGMYYAEYDSSPAGRFNELVVIPGIVWNPPTSCAWATSVVVDSATARSHGIAAVGLPSRLATFLRPKVSDIATVRREAGRPGQQCHSLVEIWTEPYSGPAAPGPSPRKEALRKAPGFELLCSLRFPPGSGGVSPQGSGMLKAPKISLELPSFSGKTQQQPDILRYSCQLQCRPRPCPPIGMISTTEALFPATESAGSSKDAPRHTAAASSRTECDGLTEKGPRLHKMATKADIQAILSARPVVAFAFEDMVMKVGAPVRAFDVNVVSSPKASKQKDVKPSFAK